MSENPYESAKMGGETPGPRPPVFKIGSVVLFLAAALLLVALLLPARRTSSEAARRVSCMNNLKQIVLGLQNYESVYGTLPPSYTVDAEGNRLHSWRTLILPYIEEASLYETIDLSKPWDDPANAKAREVVVDTYECPNYLGDLHLTTYLGVVGPDCVFSGSVPRKLEEITDGTASTVVVIDADPQHAVHWMSPHDIDEDTVVEYGPESQTNHRGILNVGFLVGHSGVISLDSDQKNRRAMLTIAGGETIPDE